MNNYNFDSKTFYLVVTFPLCFKGVMSIKFIIFIFIEFLMLASYFRIDIETQK